MEQQLNVAYPRSEFGHRGAERCRGELVHGVTDRHGNHENGSLRQRCSNSGRIERFYPCVVPHCDLTVGLGFECWPSTINCSKEDDKEKRGQPEVDGCDGVHVEYQSEPSINELLDVVRCKRERSERELEVRSFEFHELTYRALRRKR